MGGGPGGGDGAAPGTEGNLGISPGTAGNLGISASGADVGVSRGGGGSTSAGDLDALITAIPVVGPINAGMSILGMGSLGSLAQGDPDPAFGTGVSGPEGSPGVGGGPSDPLRSNVRRRAGTILKSPATPSPLLETPTISEALFKRKKFGRPETILTSRGALDESTIKPTLLGQ